MDTYSLPICISGLENIGRGKFTLVSFSLLCSCINVIFYIGLMSFINCMILLCYIQVDIIDH